MIASKVTVLVISLSLWLGEVRSLYFFLDEGEQKCFFEDLPTNVMVIGLYNLLVYDENSKLFFPANRFGVQVTVTDPNAVVTLDKTYSAQGRFIFTSEHEGQHSICISSNTSAWYGGPQMKIHLEIRVGSHDLHAIGHKETLTEMQMRMELLLEQIGMIMKEQEYQRHREISFRETSDHTSMIVIIASILLPTIVIIIRSTQMRHLTKFFITKKLV